MSDHCGMWIPRWAWRLWPGKKTSWVPVPLDEPTPLELPRQLTEQHARLLSRLQATASADWSRTALIACLEQLRTSNVTEAGQVAVLDAWVDGPDAFCVVYQSPYEDGEVGIRRTVDDASPRNQKNRPGEMTESYDMGSAEIPDPVAFGWNVADFDIGDPGTDGPLRHDEDSGTSWWGSLGDALPLRRATP